MPFRDVIGHRRLIDLLARAVARESLPPSLILAGPDGIGKRLVAVATAQALNCTNSEVRQQKTALDACGGCSSCLRIARGIHPDVLIVQPGDNGNIRIEQVREVIDQASYRPFEGRRRVVIIDQAETLMPQAQNALLKTLEEPPSASVFMLVTSRPDALLPTVLSRCPRLRFRPLHAGDVAAAMIKRGRPEPEARAVAALADGSIGRALEASGGALVQARNVAEKVLTQAAETDDARRRLDGSKDLLEGTGTGARSAEDRDQLASHLLAMASLVRDVELLSTRAENVALANPDVRPALERLSVFKGERGLHAFSAIDEALLALDKNAGVKVVADWIMLQL